MENAEPPEIIYPMDGDKVVPVKVSDVMFLLYSHKKWGYLSLCLRICMDGDTEVLFSSMYTTEQKEEILKTLGPRWGMVLRGDNDDEILGVRYENLISYDICGATLQILGEDGKPFDCLLPSPISDQAMLDWHRWKLKQNQEDIQSDV